MLTRLHHQGDGQKDKGTAEAKIDSGGAVAMMTMLGKMQSIDGGLLIIIWLAGLGGAGE
jgi:hypothetical protein